MLLQMGVPGGPELLIILVVMLITFGVPLLVVTVGGYLWFRQREGSRERLEELESEVAQLREELQAEPQGDDDANG